MNPLSKLLLVVLCAGFGALGYWTRPKVAAARPDDRKVVASASHSNASKIDPRGSSVSLNNEESDEARFKQSAELAERDPEAAARLLMRCSKWSDGAKGFINLLQKLLLSDPSAFARLAGETTEIRFLNPLETFQLMADHMSNPTLLCEMAYKLPHVGRPRLLMEALKIMARTSPAAALEIAENMGPTNSQRNALLACLDPLMAADPQATMRWMLEKKEDADSVVELLCFVRHFSAHPEAREAIVSSAPESLKTTALRASLDGLLPTNDIQSSDSYDRVLSYIRGLPAKEQGIGIHILASDYVASRGKDLNGSVLLSQLLPEERSAVIESLTATKIQSFDGKLQAGWLDTLQTPSDKAAAAKVVPFLSSLSDAEKELVAKKLTSL